jgi:hypothetical protein
VLSDAQIVSMRATSDLLLSSACTIGRAPPGEPVMDPNTGIYTDPPLDAVYSGACHVRSVGGQRVAQFGDQPVTLRVATVQLPDDAPLVRVEDVVTVTASPNPLLVGVRMRVVDDPKRARVIARTVMAEEILPQ